MKSLVCPVSPDQISENIPRAIASLTILLLFLYVLTNSILIPIYLILDFFTRGFGNSKYSLLAKLGIQLNKHLLPKSKRINKAPKNFAARLGLVMSTLIVVSHITNISYLAQLTSLTLILFASLECVLNFCLGCWVYTLFVQPFYRS